MLPSRDVGLDSELVQMATSPRVASAVDGLGVSRPHGCTFADTVASSRAGTRRFFRNRSSLRDLGKA